MERTVAGGTLFVVAGVVLFLGQQPSWLPLAYSESVAGVLSVAGILLLLPAFYFSLRHRLQTPE